jgi:hypothetical protein
MKKINQEQMELTTGGFPWASLAAGALCAYGLITAPTGVGAWIAAVSCGSVVLTD